MAKKKAKKKADDAGALPCTYDQCKVAFVKTLMELSHNRRSSDVFLDWVTCVAISFQNACEPNKDKYAEREKRYHEIRKRYTEEEFKQFPVLLAIVVQAFEDGYGDFLGETYMKLEFGNKNSGQFFTPYNLCRCMAKMIYHKDKVQQWIDEKGYVTINEPTCGGGANIVAWLEEMRLQGFNYQTQCLVLAQDLDPRCVYMCYVTLSLLHVPAEVVHCNTLSLETFEVLHTPSLCMQWLKFRSKVGIFQKRSSIEIKPIPVATEPPPPPTPLPYKGEEIQMELF